MLKILIAIACAAMFPLRAAPKGAAVESKAVVQFEHVLYRVEGEKRVPLFSDADAEVVQSMRRDTIKYAVVGGLARPELVVTRRKCTYPKGRDAKGVAIAEGSTCEETDL